MPTVVDFGRGAYERLLRAGLKLPTMVGRHELERPTSFEPPCFVDAVIDNPTALEVGAFTSISGGRIGNAGIGRYVSIAPEVRIGAHQHPMDWLTTSRTGHYPEVHGWDAFCRPDAVDQIRAGAVPFDGSCPITRIGNDVWIGHGAFIRSGVTIGDGAVIAAHSVVAQDVPAFAVVAGVPARIVRFRFEPALIARLQAVQWWRFSIYDLHGLPMNRVAEVLDGIEERLARGELAEYRPHRFGPEDLREFAAAAA